MLGLRYPLNPTTGRPLEEDSKFLRLPTWPIFTTDLAAMARRLSLPAISILIPAKDLYLVDTKISLRSCSFTSGAYSLGERICKESLEERHSAASLFL